MTLTPTFSLLLALFCCSCFRHSLLPKTVKIFVRYHVHDCWRCYLIRICSGLFASSIVLLHRRPSQLVLLLLMIIVDARRKGLCDVSDEIGAEINGSKLRKGHAFSCSSTLSALTLASSLLSLSFSLSLSLCRLVLHCTWIACTLLPLNPK